MKYLGLSWTDVLPSLLTIPYRGALSGESRIALAPKYLEYNSALTHFVNFNPLQILKEAKRPFAALKYSRTQLAGHSQPLTIHLPYPPIKGVARLGGKG